jgi:hypothetical protein
VKPTYHRFLGSGAIALGALAAVLIVNGGWQAVAAALALFGGLGFVLSFISLGAASERPHPGRPAWAGASRQPSPEPRARRRRSAAVSPRTATTARAATVVKTKMAPAAGPSA